MSDPLIGVRVRNRFTIVRPIGAGAMGAVYVASDDDGGEVALKLLKEQSEEMRAPERFLREVKLLSQLVHPNVVGFIEGGFDPALGTVFYAMELLAGDPLSRLTSTGRLRPALALGVARQVAEGLAAAHNRGFVHRDLKPGNLMLVPRDDDLRVKILDFGLAFVNGERRLTAMGRAPGTVSYMAPEQLQGKVPDHRADLHGLGVVIFEMLTGHPPYPGDTEVEIAVDVLRRPPADLNQLLPGLPAGLARLVARLLAKDRDERPASASDIVDEIASIQRSATLRPQAVNHTGPSSNPRRAWRLSDALPVDLVRPAS